MFSNKTVNIFLQLFYDSSHQIPLTLAASPTEGAAEQTMMSAQATVSTLKIPVVEDSLKSLNLRKFILNYAGHEVQTASDRLAALETARAFEPQVVLCDTSLPGMNGYEVAQCLRQQPAFAQTPLIALTGTGMRRSATAS